MLDELLASRTVDQLKPRLALLETNERPTRKVEIIALIRASLAMSFQQAEENAA